MGGDNIAFRAFLIGRTVSQLGDEITLLALPWLVAATTASPLAVGALEAVAFVPSILFGLHLGAVADRRSRRSSMIQTDLLRAALIVSVPVALVIVAEPHVAHLLFIAFAAGVAKTLFDSSAQALVADIVPRERIVVANSRLGIAEGCAIVVGPPLAGTLVAALGAATALAIDAFTFVLSAAAIASIAGIVERRDLGGVPLRGSIRVGLSFLRAHRHLVALTVLVGMANLGSGMSVGLLVLFLQQDVQLSAWEVGFVFALNGIGGLCAGAIAGRLSRRQGLCRSIVIGLWTGAIGLALISIAMPHQWGLTAGLGFGVFGAGLMTLIVASSSVRQLVVPGDLIGRVTSAYRVVSNTGVVIGALVGGLVGEWLGVRPAILVGVVIYFLVAAAALATPLAGPDPRDASVA